LAVSGDYFGVTLGQRIVTFGTHKISGIVTVNNVPASRKVVLFEYPNLVVLDAQWSDPVTGKYSFDNWLKNPTGGAGYGVISRDHTGAFDPKAKLNVEVE
jgi:hypothetical protein